MKKASKKTKKRTEPSRASLKEIPEVDFSRARVRKNPYAARIAKDGGYWIQVDGEAPRFVRTKEGRPAKGTPTSTTTTKSVRFPKEVWDALEKQAEKKGITLHAALRKAIVAWLKRAAA
jgi:hypothetical protein